MILVALVVEALKWAILIGAFLVALYWLVRFVKWAWTDKPDEVPWTAEQEAALHDISVERRRIEHEKGIEHPPAEWGKWLDVVTGHDHEGRPICQKCGVPISEGKEILLTEDEKRMLAQVRRVGSLPGAFRHMNEADCGPRSH